LRIGLIRRGFITHLDGVIRFTTRLIEAFKLLRLKDPYLEPRPSDDQV